MILFSNSPFQYFMLAVGLAIFGYFAYRFYHGQRQSVSALRAAGQTTPHTYDEAEKALVGTVAGRPFTFGQVMERAYGERQQSVRLKIAMPPVPHIEVAVKTKIGYNVVNTIWNKEPLVTVGKLALWTKDEVRTHALLQNGLVEVLQAYAYDPYQIHLQDSTLIIRSSHVLESWTEYDVRKALQLAEDLIKVLDRTR